MNIKGSLKCTKSSIRKTDNYSNSSRYKSLIIKQKKERRFTLKNTK